MAGLAALRAATLNFAQELKAQNAELFCAKVNEDFEDVIAKKIKNRKFITSKLHLLKAKIVSTPQNAYNNTTDIQASDYTETVTKKLIEQQIVKNITQNDAVTDLITSPDEMLEPELLERKKKIMAQAAEFSEKELTLRELYITLEEKHTELLQKRNEWDKVRSKLKNYQQISQDETVISGPLYRKLQMIINKIETMRWMIPKLVVANTTYDWASDPNDKLKILAMTRKVYTVDMFTSK